MRLLSVPTPQRFIAGNWNGMETIPIQLIQSAMLQSMGAMHIVPAGNPPLVLVNL